jgi:hypothetical protein
MVRMGWDRGELSFGILEVGVWDFGKGFGLDGIVISCRDGGLGICMYNLFIFVCFMCMSVFFVFPCGYSLALGLSCFIIVSATIRRWIFPVAVLGMLSVKYTWISVSCVLREDKTRGDWNCEKGRGDKPSSAP